MKIGTMALGATTVLATLAVAPMAAEAKTRLLVNCFWPPQHFVCSQVLPAWLEEVEKVTEGRVVGNIPPKSVAPPPEQLNSVEKGVVDAAVQFNGLIGNRVHGALTAMQPFSGAPDAPAMTRAAWETNQKFYPDEFENVELLAQWVITPGELFSLTDTPIVTLDEFSSRKMWALPGPLANIAKALGAGVVATPAVQSNEVIANGVVDSHLGLEGNGIKAMQVIPYTKSMTRFSQPIYATSFSFVINKDKWNEIAPADQEAIAAMTQEVVGEKAATLWDQISNGVYDSFGEQGIEVVDADPQLEKAMRDAAEPLSEAWKEKTKQAGIDADAALQFYKDRVAELTR